MDLNVVLKLESIKCHDEGDGPGNAEPYLWTVFFKADGETLVVNSDGPAAPFLQGVPTVVGTPGNHGNLGVNSVDEGDQFAIPSAIGEYRTVMSSIPLTTPIAGISEVGGMVGCIAVLMEEDNTPANAIVRGHESLDREVRDRLTGLLGALSIAHTEPSEEEIAALADEIGNAVEGAVGAGVSVVDWLVGFGNMDDQIGSETFRFSHKQLEGAAGGPIPFRRRWRNEGDWELFGSIVATPIRRQDSPCCRRLQKQVDELNARLKKLEDGRAAIIKATAGIRSTELVRPPSPVKEPTRKKETIR